MLLSRPFVSRGFLRPVGRVSCMARSTTQDAKKRPRKENVSGAFFVDHTCIDCDTCRWMSPSVFTRQGSMSAVTKQPENDNERFASMQALLSCPTDSIHVEKVETGELSEVVASFPIPLSASPDLFYCGYTDSKTFGASTYLIKTSKGNVLVDCPHFNPSLVKRIDELGGIQFIVLSHIDDVGDHAKWAQHYNATRIIHIAELNPDTRDCEIQLEGFGPWSVGEIAELQILHTPGHTRGSITLYHKPSRSMFTGDHFGYSEKSQALTVFPRYNFYDIDIQYQSLQKMLDCDFVNVYPGHGRRVEFNSIEDRNQQITAFIDAHQT